MLGWADGNRRDPWGLAKMKTYAEIKAELDSLEGLNLKIGDWIWLKASDDQPRQKAQLRGPLAAVLLVTVTPADSTDDGLRVITADKIEGRADGGE